nr:cell wall-binding repeat-containing protein [uncultured Peptostreptococcus sp.]
MVNSNKKIKNKFLAVILSVSMLPVSGMLAFADDVEQTSDQPKQVELPDTGDTLEKKFFVSKTPYFNLSEKKYHRDQIVNIEIGNYYLNIRSMFGDPESVKDYGNFSDYKMLQDNYIIDFKDENKDQLDPLKPNLAILDMDDISLAYRLFSGYLDSRSMYMIEQPDESGNFKMQKEDSFNNKEVYGGNRVETYSFLSEDESENVTYPNIETNKKIPVRLVDMSRKPKNIATGLSDYKDNILYGEIEKKDNNKYELSIKLIRSKESKEYNNYNTLANYSYKRVVDGREEDLALNQDIDYTSVSKHDNIKQEYSIGKTVLNTLGEKIELNAVSEEQTGGRENYNLVLMIDPSSLKDGGEFSDKLYLNGSIVNGEVGERPLSPTKNYLLNIFPQDDLGIYIGLKREVGHSAYDSILFTTDGSDPDENSDIARNDETNQTIGIKFGEKKQDSSVVYIDNSKLRDGGKLVLKFRLKHGDTLGKNIYTYNLNLKKESVDTINDLDFIVNGKRYNASINRLGKGGDFYFPTVYYDTKLKTEPVSDLDKKIKDYLNKNKIGRYLAMDVSLVDRSGKPADLPNGWDNHNDSITEKKAHSDGGIVPFAVNNINESDLKPVANISKKDIKLFIVKEDGSLKELNDHDKGRIVVNKSKKQVNLALNFSKPKERIIIAEADSMDTGKDPEDQPSEPKKPDQMSDLEKKIKRAKSVDLRVTKTEESIKKLDEAIKIAEAISKSGTDQQKHEQENILDSLIAKMDSSETNIKDLSTLKKSENLTEGIYDVLISTRHFERPYENSMSNEAVNKKAKLIVDKDGNRKLRFSVKGIEYGGDYGHLTKLWFYDTLKDTVGPSLSDPSLGKMNDAKIVDTHDDSDLQGLPRNFIRTIEIGINSFKEDPKRYVRVKVDAMDGLNGLDPYNNDSMDSTQPAVLCIDYRYIKKDNTNNPNLEDTDKDIDKDKDKDKDKDIDKDKDDLKLKKANKDLLQYNVDLANHMISEGMISDDSKSYVNSALKNAKEVLKNNNASIDDYKTANLLLKFALLNAKKGGVKSGEGDKKDTEKAKSESKEIITEKDLRDGNVYAIPVRMDKTYDKAQSMGNSAINKIAYVKEKDGKFEYYLTFSGIELYGKKGHLYGLSIYDNGVNSSLVEAIVDKEITEADLNGDLRKFPRRYKFARNKTKENEIFVKVSVDAMDSIASKGESDYSKLVKGAGSQNARLVFDWSNAKKIDKISDLTNDEPEASNKNTERLAGSNRYETSAKISQKYFSSADTVILASGKNNADALVSASFANAHKAPILLTNKDTTDESVLNEISRLKAKNIIIVGGSSSVSYKVEGDMRKKGYSVRRIAGNNRYETSAMIAQEVKDITKSSKAILINGSKDADALTVSGLATSQGLPVIMTRSGELEGNARAKFNAWNLDQVYLVGGTNSISDSVVNQVSAKTKTRLSGQDRFKTALAIADESYPSTKKVMFANGYNSIDALSAGAVTARAKMPILLVNRTSIPNSIKDRLSGKISQSVILGGESTIASGTIDSLSQGK